MFLHVNAWSYWPELLTAAAGNQYSTVRSCHPPFFDGLSENDGVSFHWRQMLNQWSSIHVPFTVASTFSGAMGKYESGVSNPVILDYNTFMPHVSGTCSPLPVQEIASSREEIPRVMVVWCVVSRFFLCEGLTRCPMGCWGTVAHIHPNASALFKQNISSIPLNEYAMQIVMNLPPNRVTPYVDTNFDVVRGRIIRFGSEVHPSPACAMLVVIWFCLWLSASSGEGDGAGFGALR